MAEKFYTLEEAGQLLGVSGRTFSKWARQHRPRIRPMIQGRVHTYSESQIARLAKAHGIVLGTAQPAKVEHLQQVKERKQQSATPAPVQRRSAPIFLALFLASLLLWFSTLLQRWQSRRRQP